MQDLTNIASQNEMSKRRKGPSKTAEMIALIRAAESRKPENERLFYDPYAIRFASKETLEFAAKHPEEAKALAEKLDQFMPGVNNSLLARIRFFDDIVEASINADFEQIVTLGAGYDSRAFRIKGLKERLRVFELDHPDTQEVKIEKVKEIFGELPDHVVYIPVDLGTEEIGQQLFERGYDSSRKTLFLMEGLIMYLPPEAVDRILAFVVNNSGRGSAVLFDYIPEPVANRADEPEEVRNIRKQAELSGEVHRFGINEGRVEEFLKERGFSYVQNIASEDHKKAYFQGKNLIVCDHFSFAYAVIA
jgi:methyltransferase (TIGR00027 family)